MRTFEEINADIESAKGRSDVHALRSLATEMREHGTPAAQAVSQIATGVVAMLTGDYPSALEHFRRALDMHEELGDRAGVARAIGSMGIVYLNTGDYPSALECFRRALSMHEELDDRADVARTIGNMGIVYLDTGDYPSALEHFRRALAVHEELGDRAAVARATGNMGIVYVGTGDHASALEHYRRALVVHEDLGDRARVAIVTGNMGNVCVKTGDYPSALEHYQRALTIHEELGDRANMVHVAGNTIVALMHLDRYDEAEALLNQQAAAQIDDPGARAQHFANWAAIAEHRGELDAANDHLQKARAIAVEAGLRVGSVAYHQRLRDLAQKRNDFAGYIEHNNEYLRITEEIRGKETTQRIAMMEAEKRIAAERAETEKHRALLYNTLPPSIADRVLRGEQVNDAFDNAAVIFMDMVGFTTMSSSMDPNDVVRLLSGIFTACDAIMNEHGLMKIKTIGDSYMAVAFPSEQVQGEAEQRRDIAQRAARAALQLLHEVSPAGSHEVSPEGSHNVSPEGSPAGSPSGPRFRIGIHIGPVTAGVIGTERLQYDVWGDTVNVASRMESSSQPGSIHVSQAFAQALDPGFRRGDTVDGHPGEGRDPYHAMVADAMKLRERGEVEIKGKGAMTTYWLEGAA